MSIAIFGAAGAIGRSVAAALDARGIPFRAVGRSKARLSEAFGRLKTARELVSADLADPADARRAARGVETIVYTVGVSSYAQFALHPQLMRTTLEAAQAEGVRSLLLVSSVYSYAAGSGGLVNESYPRTPPSRKGALRKEQEDLVSTAHAEGRIRGAILHLPDFYGADAENSLASLIFTAALTEKFATVLAPIDTPHEFVYTPDVGPVILDLIARDEAWGAHWNLAGPALITVRDFALNVFRSAATKPYLLPANRTVLTALGYFNPTMRELIELSYLQSNPVNLDDSRLRALLGRIVKTSYHDGIGYTVQQLRRRPVQAVASNV
jgi:nucleoside-diphosphate-sugar epimerase